MDPDTNDQLRQIFKHFVSSNDCNGFRAIDFSPNDEAKSIQIAESLIRAGKVRAITGQTELNPHIIRVGFPDQDHVLATIQGSHPYHVVLYPTQSYLEDNLDLSEYASEPYTSLLKQGEPHLSIKFFDTSILEWYQHDPRYVYHFDDIRGWIAIGDEAYESPEVMPKEKVHLKTFGIGYCDDAMPVVVAFIRDLSKLSPEHQAVWLAKELGGDYKVHPDFIRNNIYGEWGQFVSIYDCLIDELELVNQMCDAIGWPRIFLNSFKSNRPRDYGLLLRPTKKRFEDFALTLDKMLSDNLNRKFFAEQGIELEERTDTKSGEIEIIRKGTLRLLEDWIRKSFRPKEGDPAAEIVGPLKAVRKARQPSAHKVVEDSYSPEYVKKQKAMIDSAYEGIRTLRLILANHPRARSVDIPGHLVSGTMIWSY